MRKKEIKTLHGDLITPTFMPDATYGVIQAVETSKILEIGVPAMVTTTLHIEQHLGSQYISKFGGIHKFMGYDRPILTDSGGFQVFSLINKNKKDKHNRITNAGCSFIDYRTGKYNFLSPESSQVIQNNLGSDICVVLDEPVIENDSIHRLKSSVIRTTEWAKRAKKTFLELNNLTENDFNNPKLLRPLLTAVVQGGNNKDLRKQSAEELIEIGFDIYGFGGIPKYNDLSWKDDAPKGFHLEMIEYVASLLPEDKIRYALGVGSPDDIQYAASVGWDIFDTVLPTRNARHGYIYVHKGQGDMSFKNYDVLHIKSKRYEFDDNNLDAECDCDTCQTISRAYLRYLMRIKEPVAYRLASIHNLHFYQRFIEQLS